MPKPKHVKDAPPSFGGMVLGWLKEIGIVVVSALFLSFLIKLFFFQSFWIPSSSMEPTLNIGDRILVTKWRPGPLDLRRGDVVVFRDPTDWLGAQPSVVQESNWLGDALIFVGLMPDDSGEHLVKRVIGLPGDTVECRSGEGQVIVNGTPIEEPYIEEGTSPCAGGNSIPWITTVPEGYVWVMGDNRPNSADSRFHTSDPGAGSIPMENIVGSAFVTVWPLDHWGGIGNPLAGEQAAAA